MEVHFTPEQEAKLTQIAASAGTGAEELVKNAALRLLENAPFEAPAPEDRPVWEIIVERMNALPPQAFEGLPKDGASQIDHYLYGHSKRD